MWADLLLPTEAGKLETISRDFLLLLCACVHAQNLLEMEMLMSRAEQDRVALERELRAMRATAGEAALHLHLAEEGLRVTPLAYPCVSYRLLMTVADL